MPYDFHQFGKAAGFVEHSRQVELRVVWRLCQVKAAGVDNDREPHSRRADSPDEVEAGQPRHIVIGEQQVVASGEQCSPRVFSVRRSVHRIAGLRKHQEFKALRGDIVVHDQDSPLTSGNGLPGRGR